MEVWKDVKGYEGLYQVSSYGRIKSCEKIIYYLNSDKVRRLQKEKIMSFGIGNGYYIVTLYNNGKSKKYYVHQLVAMSFLNHIPNKYELVVDHINNNKLDNNLNNLQVVTHSDNVRKGFKRKDAKTSKYKGVYLEKRTGKYISSITISKKNIYLGAFKTEIEAYNKYVEKCNELNYIKK